METSLTIFLQAVISLFAIVDPVGGLPIFLGLTTGARENERRKVFMLAVVIAFIVVLGFSLAGSFILGQIFHISLSEFMFAGGLLLVVVGIHDMLASGSHFETNLEDSPKHERSRKLQAIAISPIACPLLAGPGTIVTVMVYQGQSGQIFALSVCLVVFLLTMLILMFAGAISKFIGRIGMLAISRVMQIFIIAIGVHFMFAGLSQSFPELFK